MKATLTLILFLVYNFGSGQVQLTKFNPGNAPQSSRPSQFFKFNNSLFFLSENEQTGREIWTTDGAAGETSILKDIHLGVGSSVYSNFLEYKSKLYFIADNGIGGPQLWVSDGSASGTQQVTDNIRFPVAQIVQDGDFIYYLQRQDAKSVQLWKTDGTQAGGTLIKGQIPAWNEPQNLTAALGLVFFSVQIPETSQSRVWRSDGTEAGTFSITEPLEGIGATSNARVHPTQFIQFQNALFFVARSSFSLPNDVGIVKTDGTVEGTGHLIGIHPGSLPIAFADAIVHQDKMYFAFFDLNTKRYFIWESQGLAVNTTKLFDFTSAGYFTPSTLFGVSDYLYFTTGNDTQGTSLVRLNVLTRDSQTIKEVSGKVEPPFIFLPLDANLILGDGSGNMFIKSATGNILYRELWRSDGTSTGTIKLSRIGQAYENLLILSDQQVYFSGAGTDNSFELWKSDGTAAGTVLAKDINPSMIGLNFPTQLIEASGKAFFTADSPPYGQELVVSDGSLSGTITFDLFPGSPGSFPSGFLSQNDSVYFIASGEGGKSEVFSSDGTSTGTFQVTNFAASGMRVTHISPGPPDSIFVCSRRNTDNTASLFSLNLVSGEVMQLKDFGKNSFNAPVLIEEVRTVNNILYLKLDHDGHALWRSDGTSAGTSEIATFTSIDGFMAGGNIVYFTAKTPASGDDFQLYRSDGTSEGTVMLNQSGGFSFTNADNLFGFNDKLVFTAFNAATGHELWITDGTQNNTSLLKDIYQGAASSVSAMSDFSVQGNLIFFAADDGQHGIELWKSDGTEAGTLMVKDIVAGAFSSSPKAFRTVDGTTYFSAYTAENGFEVWSSNGTPDGTKLLVDVLPGVTYSNPEGFIKLDDNLLFVGSTLSSGRQLWSYGESVTAISEDRNAVVSVYPNPTTSGIVKIIAEQMPEAVVAVYNAQGVCVASPTGLTRDSQINLANLPSGLYYLKIMTGTNVFILRTIRL